MEACSFLSGEWESAVDVDVWIVILLSMTMDLSIMPELFDLYLYIFLSNVFLIRLKVKD